MSTRLPPRDSVSGAESNFTGFREPSIPGLRRIPEATRTPSILASCEVNGDQDEFDLVPRALLKTMFDIKPHQWQPELLAGTRMGSGWKQKQPGLSRRCHKSINKTACFPQQRPNCFKA